MSAEEPGGPLATHAGESETRRASEVEPARVRERPHETGTPHSLQEGVTRAREPEPARAGAMPYEPSVPCARCARGVDPLRAACVSVSERGVRYFCSRSCRDAWLHEQGAETRGAARETVRARFLRSDNRPQSSLEPVAQRIELPAPTTPIWPLSASVLLAGASFLPLPRAVSCAALALIAVAALFAPRTRCTRRAGGAWSSLNAPLGSALLALSALLAQNSWFALAAGLGLALSWLREHLVERAEANMVALQRELAARFSSRVHTFPADSEGVDARSRERALASLREDEDVLVEAPGVVPVDGVVVDGSGELLPYRSAREPIARGPGASVLAGALLLRGALRVRARRVGLARVLFRAFAPIRDDETPASAALALAQRARGALIGALQAGAALSLGLITAERSWQLSASLGAALLWSPGLALARGLGAPLRAALLRAAERGVCFRAPASIERAGQVDTALLRVEGVLVDRTYSLAEVHPLSPSHGVRELLALAASAESAADNHPLARAVRAHAEQLGVEPVPLRRVSYARGRGINALTDGEGPLLFGNREVLLSHGVSVAVADHDAQRAELAGNKVVFLALGGHLRGLFVFAQALRPEARVAVQTLFDLGLSVELVSGDHRTTTEALARALDVAQCKAELSAEQRVHELRRLQDGDARAVTIGRAPEDAPLLAAAELSLCLDLAGIPAEHAVSTACLDLRDAVAALITARRARHAVQRVHAAALAGAALCLLAAAGALFAPLVPLLVLPLDLLCLRSEAALARGFGRRDERASRPQATD